MTRTAGTGRANADDITGVLAFADLFLARMRKIEGEPRASDLAKFARYIIEQIRGKRKQPFSLLMPLGDPLSPSRDPNREADFTLELFGFIAAIRTARHYLFAIVARTAGETHIRNALKAHLIELHVELGNQGLHQRLLQTARTFAIGGAAHGRWHYSYNAAALDARALPHFNAVQATAGGNLYDVTTLSSMVLDELRSIDQNGRQSGWY